MKIDDIAKKLLKKMKKINQKTQICRFFENPCTSVPINITE